MSVEQKRKALPAIAEAAVLATKGTICPAEMIAAQCAEESGWLDHAPQNNCFGIKAYPGAAGRQLLKTEEWFTEQEAAHFLTGMQGRRLEVATPLQTNAKGRKHYHAYDWFATFDDLADCFKKRVELFDAGVYHPFAEAYRQTGDLDTLVRSMAEKYATSPIYANEVLSIVHDPEVQAALAAARQKFAT